MADKLTALTVKKAEPAEKAYKLADGGGLYMEVMPNGSRYWRMKYRFAGKEKRLAFGVFPEVTLAEARQSRESARAILRADKDPGAERRAAKMRARVSGANTFEVVGREWLESQRKTLAASTFKKAEWTLENQVFPWLGADPIDEIEAPALLAVLRRIEARGARDTAHRTKERCGQVFRYAIATGRAKRDPSVDLRGALAPPVRKSHAALTDPTKVGELLRALDGYEGQFTTRCALRLAPMVFARPSNLRHAEWSEFDLIASEWRIPAWKMKMN